MPRGVCVMYADSYHAQCLQKERVLVAMVKKLAAGGKVQHHRTSILRDHPLGFERLVPVRGRTSMSFYVES